MHRHHATVSGAVSDGISAYERNPDESLTSCGGWRRVKETMRRGELGMRSRHCDNTTQVQVDKNHLCIVTLAIIGFDRNE